MEEKFYAAGFSFINPILTDIFSRYADNSVMAGIVSEDGRTELYFRTEFTAAVPSDAEQVLSLLFRLLEADVSQPLYAVYSAHREDILRDTVLRLSQTLNGFVDVKISLYSSENSTRTDFTLKRERNVTTETQSQQ